MSRPFPGLALPDVNVLLALAWPNHTHHEQAKAWFSDSFSTGWATTSITELGLVRLSCNRAVVGASTTPRAAVDLLTRLCALRGHRFWPDTVQRVTDDADLIEALVGYRQVTDAHLIAICDAHEGHLVTFDRGAAELGAGVSAPVRLLAA